jgi:DNA-binding MarR family transcriptional regulator
MPPKAEITERTVDIFWSTFPPLWHKIRAHIREEAIAPFDITVSQFHILRRIDSGKDTVSKLADVKHISRAAISRTVDVLVNKGLITRTQNPKDRRHVQLTLTEEGKILLRTIFDDVGAWMESKLARLDEDELGNIIAAIETLNRAFEHKIPNSPK